MKDEAQPDAKRISAVALSSRAPVAMKALPNTLTFFTWGDNPSNKGSFTVDDASLSALRAQIADEAHNRILIDFEHQSCKQSPNFKPSPRHHVGYGKLAILEGNAIGATDIEYTSTGREFAEDYYDVSPVAIHTKDGRVLGIQSAALVPEGALHGRTLFSADYEPPTQETTPMDANDPVIVALQTALADMNAKVDGLKSENAALRGLLEEFQKRPTPLDAGALTPLQAEATAATAAAGALRTDLSAQATTIADQGKMITALSASITAQRKETMIQLAAQQGKPVALTDTAITAMSVEDLAAHISALGATVPMVRQTPAGSGGESVATTALAAQQNALVAQIERETRCHDFRMNWDAARLRKPDLFR